MKRIKILNIPIDPLTKKQVADKIGNLIDSGLPNQIATVNPEFIVEASKNPKFKKTLQSTQLNVADGVGIKFAATFKDAYNFSWQPAKMIFGFLQFIFLLLAFIFYRPLFKKPVPEVITGVDLTYFLMGLANSNNLRVYLLGGAPGIANLAAQNLTSLFPGLNIVGAEEGLPAKKISIEEKEALTRQLINRIKSSKPHILLVAFGAPKQDLFIDERKYELGAPIMMGVGGTFDFIAEKIKRAPKPIRLIGMEWFWRLLKEPKRLPRIYRATIVFLWINLKHKMFK